jgi:transposase
MKAIIVPALSPEQQQELDSLYRTTKDARLRTRAQMVLLSAEKQMKAGAIAEIVRESHVTVLLWLHRYLAEGVEGLEDAPRSGRPKTITSEYQTRLLEVVRQRPRSLELPFSMWTLQRLAAYLAEQTGIRVTDDTVRRLLGEQGIVFSRPQHVVTSPDPEYRVKKRRWKPPVMD